MTETQDETEYLLSSAANKKHLLAALANVNAGKVVEVNLDDYDLGKLRIIM
jgi:antitoxin YefM